MGHSALPEWLMPASPTPRLSCRRIRLPDQWMTQKTLVLVWRFHLRAIRAGRGQRSAGVVPPQRKRRAATRSRRP
jgi:hypothetical protein